MKLKHLQLRLSNAPTTRLKALPEPSKAKGYRIRGGKLQRIREAHLRAHPLCVLCMDAGRVRVADEVDHILPLSMGGTDTADNRQSLCIECHKAKTRAEQSRR